MCDAEEENQTSIVAQRSEGDTSALGGTLLRLLDYQKRSKIPGTNCTSRIIFVTAELMTEDTIGFSAYMK